MPTNAVKITTIEKILERENIAIHYTIYMQDSTQNNHDKILVQIAHGMVEHRGKYHYIATKLAQSGYIVAINDHRGHGDSIGGTIYWGEMGENGFEMALNDMYHLHLELKAMFKPTRFVLIGHSMGSLLARRFLQEYENSLDMLILCGTPSPNIGINIGIYILKICKAIGFNDIGRNLAQHFSIISFNAKYHRIDRLNDGKPSGILWINSDENELKKHWRDEKCHFVFTINSFINLLNGMKKVFSPYPNAIKKHNLPILFISGEDDACGKHGKGVVQAFKHIVSQGYNNAKCILYANARHELFLEKNKDIVARDIVEFIDKNPTITP